MKHSHTMLCALLCAVLAISISCAQNETSQVIPESPAAVETMQPPLPPASWQDAYELANGIRIHYWRTGGDKPVLLLAHGSSDYGLCWTNVAQALEGEYDIIMADARGHGLSDPPSQSDGVDAPVEDLAGLIRELKLEKPIIMGHSMGSASAAWFAARYPDVPRAVVLVDPGLTPRRTGDPRSSSAPEAVEKRRAQILERNNMSYSELVALCMKNNGNWDRTEIEYWALSKKLHHPDTAFRSPGDHPSMSELFPQITAPTLILKADAQGELRQQNEAVAGLLKNGRIVHVEGAVHSVQRDRLQPMLQVLREFLAGV